MGVWPKEDRMRRSRFAQDQIVGVLQEHEAGAVTAAFCRQHGISEQTLNAGSRRTVALTGPKRRG
jgi:putative transposase